MTCDCCSAPEGPFYVYAMTVVVGTIRFCSRHLKFFEKCAGKVEAES